MTSGHRPPSSPRGFSGFCLMAQVTTGLIRSIRSIRSIRGKRIIVYPLAYCPPGRVSYRAYPGTPPPSVYQVTRGTAFQAAERYVRRLSCGDGYPYHQKPQALQVAERYVRHPSCGDGYPYHQKPQALQAAERYVRHLSYLYDSWLKWGKKGKCEVKTGWALMYFLMGSR